MTQNQLMAESLAGDDFREGVAVFVEKRPPCSLGSSPSAKAPQVYAAGYPGADFTALIWRMWSILCSRWNAIHSVTVSGPNTG